MSARIRPLFLALPLLLALPLSAQAATMPANWQAGRDYAAVEDPQPAYAGAREYFMFGCPHCHDFESVVRAQKKPVALTRVPGVFGGPGSPTWVGAQAFYAARLMGQESAYVAAAFAEIHQRGGNPALQTTYIQAARRIGLDPQKFGQLMFSFGVDRQVRAAAEEVRDLNVTVTPTIVVNGRYRVTPVHTQGNFGQMLQRVSVLSQVR